MAFDGLILKSVIQELKPILIDGKIAKIYQPNTEELLLGIYSQKKNYMLSINTSFSNYSIHLTTNIEKNPLSALNFCMVLRKHCMGYLIKDIYSINLDRIAILELEGYNELNDLTNKKLIIELMGKHSNIILLDQNNNIIDSLKHFNTFSGSIRNILPKYKYTLPPNNKLNLLDSANYENIINNISNSSDSNNKSLINYFLENYTGISKQLLLYITQKYCIENYLNIDNFNNLYNILLDYVKSIENNKVECIKYNNDFVLSISNLKKNDIITENISNNINSSTNNLYINWFLDDLYFEKKQSENIKILKNKMLNTVSKKIKSINNKLEYIKKKQIECDKMDIYRLYGELLTSYMYKIDNRINISNISLENYYDNNKIISVPLDIKYSPSENAKRYFKKYHKLKNTFEIISVQQKDFLNELKYFNSIVFEIEDSNNIENLMQIEDELKELNLVKNTDTIVNNKNNKNKNNKNKSEGNNSSLENFEKHIIENYTILVGKNNKQNDYLTCKLAKPYDLWFHVKDFHGSHIVLQLPKNCDFPHDNIIEECAKLAVLHSNAKNSSNVLVDFTYIKYVKKPSKSKPGMVIYTNEKTINI